MITRKYTFFVIFLSLTLSACFGGGGGGNGGETAPIDLWTWISGSDTVNQSGTYGNLGVAVDSNVPGGRQGAMTWIDASGDFWLFGGWGYDSTGTFDRLNDLWRWDGTNWTWISGSDTVGQSGSYGTQGTANVDNVPGARNDAVSWTDASGDFWLFGGFGYDSGGSLGRLNDLWRWDGTNWTWISGSDSRNQTGNYGIQGTANVANVPGARNYGISWIDASGNLWLFGGSGYAASGTFGQLNDLWRWDGTNWTWISGSDTRNQNGNYGSLDVAVASNVPGGRQAAMSWTDANDNLWLLGGYGYDSAGSTSQLNDLWRWDGTNWTWISGSDTVDQAGSYGAQGTADPANVPGARYASVSSTDASGDLWLFGGQGIDGSGTPGRLNDLWRWDGTNWTWISGSNTVGQSGNYGTQGTADVANAPGARNYGMSWSDASGDFWLFGGFGYDTGGNLGRLNDLWRYQP